MNAEKLSSPILVESARTTLAKQLLESWRDRDYRAEFVRERVRSSIALQIRSLREQRNGMTQKQLGDAIGKKQTWISVLEDPEYGKMSVATLLSLAEAFDTDLEIRFRPFSRALHELTKQGPEYFEVRSFEEELPDLENAATLKWIIPTGAWSDIGRAAHLLAQEVSPNSNFSEIANALAGPTPVLIAMPETSTKLREPRRPRKLGRSTRRKEFIRWLKKKPQRVKFDQSSSPSTEEEKTLNPCMQTAFTFNLASGI